MGTLEYIRPSGFALSRWTPVVYALLGILALLAITVACTVLIICLVCIIKRSNSRYFYKPSNLVIKTLVNACM